jgi:hypothetical protein
MAQTVAAAQRAQGLYFLNAAGCRKLRKKRARRRFHAAVSIWPHDGCANSKKSVLILFLTAVASRTLAADGTTLASNSIANPASPFAS